MTECEVIRMPPEVAGVPDDRIEITGTPSVEWKTPGSVLTEQIVEVEHVHAIFETASADGYTVFVLLKDDPEDVLDRVFAAEQTLYESFPKMPFDVRVIKRRRDWNVEALSQSTVCRFRRAE